MSKTRHASQGIAAAPESLDAVRRRARHRLMGAAVLVLAGVVGFPLLFDTQPRPIAVDIPIEIPSRQAAKPAAAPVTAPMTAPIKPDATATVKDSLDEREQVVAAGGAAAPNEPVPAAVAAPKPEPKPEARPDLKPEVKPEPKPEPKPDARPEPKPATRSEVADGARAQAALEGKTIERIVVQVGAYAERARAQEVRQKLERAGLKTYTHVANTPDGERIRVRIGPFESRAEAEKAAAKVKGLGLATAILTL